jgi:lysophospholipase L1-like esterase
MKPWGLLFALLLLFLISADSHAQEAFQIHDGDRVVFYGDSITEPRLYTAFVETYTVTRFPKLHVHFRDSAWGGDRVTGGRGGPIDVRLQRDVIAQKPTVFAIMLGANDGHGLPYDADLFKTFTSGYEHIVNVVHDALPDARITVVQPAPYDDFTRPPAFPGGYNAVLLRYGTFVKHLGESNGLTVADLNSLLATVLKEANNIDGALAQRIGGDRTHPGPPGHLILAQSLLQAWNAPALVSWVEIDASQKQAVQRKKTSVDDLKITRNITWTQLDQSLPFPVDLRDPAMALAVRCSDFMQALDQELLRVTGLAAPHYQLRIDGQTVADLGREQLAAGINLAFLDTPMKRQALHVYALTRERNEVQFGRWRQVQMALEDEPLRSKQAALDALDQLEEALWREQNAAAQPTAQYYELIPN